MSVFGEFRPLNIIVHCRDPQKALPCAKPSDEPSRVKIGSVVFAVGDDKKKRKGKERKGTKSHKAIIFHVVVEKPHVNGFLTKFHTLRDMADVIICAKFDVEKLRG